MLKNNLKEQRLSKNMTQEELAYKAELSLSTVRNIEANRSIPTIVAALKIKKVLQIEKIEDLFDII